MTGDGKTYSIIINGGAAQAAGVKPLILRHQCDEPTDERSKSVATNVNQAQILDTNPPLEQPPKRLGSVPPPWCFAPMDGCPLCKQYPPLTLSTPMPSPCFSSLSPYNPTASFAYSPAVGTTASSACHHSVGATAPSAYPYCAGTMVCSACSNIVGATAPTACPNVGSATSFPSPPTLVPTSPYPWQPSVGATAPCVCPPTGCLTANVRSPNVPMGHSCSASAQVAVAPPLAHAATVVPVCTGTPSHLGVSTAPALYSPPSFPIAPHVVSCLRSAMPSCAHGDAPNQMPVSSAAYHMACRNGGGYQARQPISIGGPFGLPNECHADGRAQVATRVIAGADFTGGAFGAGGKLTDDKEFCSPTTVPASIIGTTVVPGVGASATTGRTTEITTHSGPNGWTSADWYNGPGKDNDGNK